jgi:hypothetical protein
MSSDTTTTPTNNRHDLQVMKKKIETGEHYFTKEELYAIWWDGYEHGSIDSAYDCYDKGYAAAISDYEIAWRKEYEG